MKEKGIERESAGCGCGGRGERGGEARLVKEKIDGGTERGCGKDVRESGGGSFGGLVKEKIERGYRRCVCVCVFLCVCECESKCECESESESVREGASERKRGNREIGRI